MTTTSRGVVVDSAGETTATQTLKGSSEVTVNQLVREFT